MQAIYAESPKWLDRMPSAATHKKPQKPTRRFYCIIEFAHGQDWLEQFFEITLVISRENKNKARNRRLIGLAFLFPLLGRSRCDPNVRLCDIAVWGVSKVSNGF